MPRPSRLDTKLQAAAKHVNYEIVMMKYATETLGAEYGSPPVTVATEAKNMALEGFLLHFRNLRAFLCPSIQKTPTADDILASDFMDFPDPHDMGDPVQLSSKKKILDQMLAHLSYSRDEHIAAGANWWQIERMLEAMMDQLVGFRQRLPADRARWFPAIQPMRVQTQPRKAHTTHDPPI
jgi:hypothetical protein